MEKWYCTLCYGLSVLRHIAGEFHGEKKVEASTKKKKNSLLDLVISNKTSLITKVKIRDNLGSSDQGVIMFDRTSKEREPFGYHKNSKLQKSTVSCALY